MHKAQKTYHNIRTMPGGYGEYDTGDLLKQLNEDLIAMTRSMAVVDELNQNMETPDVEAMIRKHFELGENDALWIHKKSRKKRAYHISYLVIHEEDTE
jgi:hypothetical protein